MTTVALITGANKGIGFETARQLAQKGIKVLLGARDEKRGLEAANVLKSEGLDVEYVNVDVDNLETHKSVGNYIQVTGIKIHPNLPLRKEGTSKSLCVYLCKGRKIKSYLKMSL